LTPSDFLTWALSFLKHRLIFRPADAGSAAVPEESELLYRFDDYALDTDRRELRRGTALVSIEPQVFDILAYLVQNRDRVVTKDDLIASIWEGRIVSESALTTRINAARSAIGDSGKQQRLIKTLPRKGVRFVATVQEERKPAAVDLAEQETATLAPPDHPSIAVLPFTNLSDDPEQQYFADAMTEEVTVALGRVPRLFVIASSSAFTYKARLVDTKRIGAELGVRYVLRGSVRKSDDLVRIIVELSDASSGNQVWSDRMDGTLDDVFELQDRVAASVSARIAPRIRSAELELARRKPTHSSSAYDLYLRALPPLRDSLAQNEESLQLLYKAIELDPTFGAAYGLAAWCYHIQVTFGWLDCSHPRIAEGVRLAHLGAESGENDPEALWMAGWSIKVLAGEPRYSLGLIEKSLSLNPNSANAWWTSGMSHAYLGETDTAIEHLGRARRLNPLDPSGHAHWAGLAHALLFGGRYEEARIAIDKALVQWPRSPVGLRAKAAICGLLGHVDEGRSCVRQYLAVSPASDLAAVRRYLELQLVGNPNGLNTYLEGLRLSGLA
jgi:TolB-like protein